MRQPAGENRSSPSPCSSQEEAARTMRHTIERWFGIVNTGDGDLWVPCRVALSGVAASPGFPSAHWRSRATHVIRRLLFEALRWLARPRRSMPGNGVRRHAESMPGQRCAERGTSSPMPHHDRFLRPGSRSWIGANQPSARPGTISAVEQLLIRGRGNARATN